MSDNHLLEYFNNQTERFIAEWRDFLRFPSISTDSSYAQACVDCSNWLADHLIKLGFQCDILQTKGHPVVFAERKGAVGRPSVLFYGHYDVQPPDPLELWRSAPFEPEIRNGRMYGRGAQDNKGQVFYFIKAVEALLAHNIELPTIKMLIEGEEESGSEGITAELPAWSEKVSADVLMVCDTGMIDAAVPTITMGLRGMAGCEIRVHGPSYDLHSGVFGGIVANPLHEIARIAASLHDDSGRVAVPGFYEGVETPSVDLSKRMLEAPIDIERLQETVGVPFVGGERDFGILERRGLRPTLEINGIGGGYQGAGGKTVIPSSGFMKITMRLVKGQDPHRVLSLLESFVVGSASAGFRVEVLDKNAGGEALLLPVDSAILETASRVIVDEFKVRPALLWEGASIPIIPLLEQVSGATPLLIGFGLEEDAIHAPNESFSLKQFEDGFRYVTAFLQRL